MNVLELTRGPDLAALSDLLVKRMNARSQLNKAKDFVQRSYPCYKRYAGSVLEIESGLKQLKTQANVPNVVYDILNDRHTEVCEALTDCQNNISNRLSEIAMRQAGLDTLEKTIQHEEELKTNPKVIQLDLDHIAKSFPQYINTIEYIPAEQVIKIVTKPIIATLITEPDAKFTSVDGTVEIPPLKVYFKPKASLGSYGMLRFHGLNFSYANGFNTNAPHPHILQDGKPCLGDFECPLAEAFDMADFYLYLDIIFEFLSQINTIEDRAGMTWPNMFIKQLSSLPSLHKFEYDRAAGTYTITKSV